MPKLADFEQTAQRTLSRSDQSKKWRHMSKHVLFQFEMKFMDGKQTTKKNKLDFRPVLLVFSRNTSMKNSFTDSEVRLSCRWTGPRFQIEKTSLCHGEAASKLCLFTTTTPKVLSQTPFSISTQKRHLYSYKTEELSD